MERMLVAIFDSEDKARAAAQALEDLDEQSVIDLYADAIVTKDRHDAAKVVKTHRADPQGRMGGTAVGSLLGVLGGHIGLALGAAAGFVMGAVTDYAKARVDRDFVAEVVKALAPGKTAVVAEIDEESTEPVNARMKALGGRVLRRELSKVVDTEYERKIDARHAD